MCARWLIEVLRYIVFCGGGDDEEPDRGQYGRIPVYHSATSPRNENQWRSHPSPPVTRSQQSHAQYGRIPEYYSATSPRTENQWRPHPSPPVIRPQQSHPPPPRPLPSPAAKPTTVSVNPSPPSPASATAAKRVSPTIPPPQPPNTTVSPSLPATKPPVPRLSPAAKPPSVVSPTTPLSQSSKTTVSPSLPATKPPGPHLSPAAKPPSVFINPSPPPRRPQEPPIGQPSSVILARFLVVKRSPLPKEPLDSPPSSQSFGDSSPKPSPSNRRSALSRYEIPEDLNELFKNDKLPPVLRRQLTPSTYTDYFAALLYAEDYYTEKWSEFLLDEVMLELRSRSSVEASRKTKKSNKSTQTNKKDFVAFEIDSVPERRPYLLSRDFVIVRPLGKNNGPFKGVIFRVVKSTTVLVEFGDDFHAQHSSNDRYDVSFSFNRVCLKRAHCAVSAAKDPTFLNLLFPDARGIPSLSYPTYFPHSYGNPKQYISPIINHTGPQPYLIEGPRSITIQDDLSTAGSVIREAILQIFRTVEHSRILICSPENRTCDVLMRSLQEIPKWKLFRANAAFRDYDDVPHDIIPTCLYEGECFSCPPLSELQEFKIITSTFMSSYKLHSAGLGANHFTHIFLVDASSATEPEAIVTLTNLAGKETVVVVTGSQMDSPFRMRVRSDIGRRHGLTRSYFHRLLEREPYLSCHPNFFTRLKE